MKTLAVGIAVVMLLGSGVAMSAEPTKEAAVQVLRELDKALVAKDWAKAVTFFPKAPNTTDEQAIGNVKQLAESNEISAKGIDALAAKGRWGKLADVAGQRQANRAKRAFGVDPDQCWGLVLEESVAGFFWTGSEFKIVRVNNIARLAK